MEKQITICRSYEAVSCITKQSVVLQVNTQCVVPRQCLTCKEHGDDLKYWCRDCKEQLCSLCLYSNHPPRHKVLLMKAYVQEKKDALQGQIKLIETAIGKTNSKIKADFCEYTTKITSLCNRNTILNNLQMDIAALSSDIQKASSIEAVQVCEATVKSFMEDKGPLSVWQDTKRLDQEGEPPSAKEAPAAKCMKGEPDAQQQTLTVSGDRDDGQRNRLDYRDGRLLIHCLHTTVDNHLFLKV